MAQNAPTSLNCPACSAPLETDGTSAVVRCKFCGNVSLIPGLLPEKADARASTLDEIRDLATSGDLMGAIHHYRQAYGGTDQDAADAISALQASRLATPASAGARPAEERTQTLKKVQVLIAAGKKVEAVRAYREVYDVGLGRAKAAVDLIEVGGSLQSAQDYPPSAQPYPAVTPAPARKSLLGCIFVGVLLLIAAGVGGFLLFQRGGPLSIHYINNGPAVFIPSSKGEGPLIAAALYNADKDSHFAGLIDATTGKPSWYASDLAGESNISNIAAGSDTIFVANESTLIAYHSSDGSLAWQTQMTDRLNYGDSTMLVTSSRVITTNLDQSIQAYDAVTGSLAWDMHLAGYDRTLRLMGGSLVVVDYTAPDSYDYGIFFVDPITGAVQHTITTACSVGGYDFSLDPDAGLIYDPSGNALYVVYDSYYGCVQRFDLTTGQIVWETGSQDNFSLSMDGFQALTTDSTIFMNASENLLAVDKSNGKISVLINNPDYDMIPVALVGDRLIVRAHRSLGSDRFELWGVDAASGSLAWQMTLQNASPIDPPDEMSGLVDESDYGFTWQLSPAGLVVITFKGQPNQMVMETYKLSDGTKLDSKTIALPKVSGDFYGIPAVISSQDNLVFLSVDLSFYSLDLSTGTLKYIY